MARGHSNENYLESEEIIPNRYFRGKKFRNERFLPLPGKIIPLKSYWNNEKSLDVENQLDLVGQINFLMGKVSLKLKLEIFDQKLADYLILKIPTAWYRKSLKEDSSKGLN